MVAFNRRQFLAGALGTAALLAIGSYPYLDDKKMEKPKKKDGLIIADLHAHPGRNHPQEELTSMLSWGLTGLTASNYGKIILSYHEAINLQGAKEIDKGLFAEFNHNGKKGYFANIQEVMSDFHILAIGCKETLPDYADARKTVEEIHKQDGIAILNHPLVIPEDSWKRYRLLDENGKKKLKELCTMVDEIEVFNAQCINLIPVIAWMHWANEDAKKLATAYGFKGTAASDTHVRLEQVKVSGIYVPEKHLSIEALKHHIKTKNFERLEHYVSRLSFLEGMGIL